MINSLWKPFGVCILVIFLFSPSLCLSQTKEAESTSKDSAKQNHVDLKVEDLPAPIPKVMETLQRIGNNVGQEISRATSKAAGAVNKAVREDKPSGNK